MANSEHQFFMYPIEVGKAGKQLGLRLIKIIIEKCR